MRNLISIGIILFLTACTTIIPRDEHVVSKGGIPYIRHINPPYPTPCGFLHWDAGCYARFVDGSHHVYITDIAPPHVLMHEESHVDGMRHSDWDSLGCSRVVSEDSQGKYQLNDRLCIKQHYEEITRNKKAEKE